MSTLKIAIISTGGTIEKTYCSIEGVLRNGISVLDTLLEGLETPGLSFKRVPLMNVDSSTMNQSDHDAIAVSVRAQAEQHDAVIVIHGTDRLAESGECILEHLQATDGLRCPVILTGAMRPFELRTSDAVQNVTESILAAQLLAPGVYCVMHSQVLGFPGVVKDVQHGRFVRTANC